VTKSRRTQRGQSVLEFALVLPIMMVILLGVVDLARIYTTMLSVESAAREAADYATTLGAARWAPGAKDITVAEMQRRACVASSDLPDYAGDDPTLPVVTCTNPAFTYCLTTSAGGTCLDYDATALCDDPVREPPCRVTVTLTYDFHLFMPTAGLASTITFDRSSTYAMTDIDLAPTP
jgi:Flp pilus assembly protein TadG